MKSRSVWGRLDLKSEWKEVTLENCVSVLGDGLHGTPIFDDSGDYYFINGNNIQNNRIEIKSDTKKVTEAEYLKYKKPLNRRTLLVSINGTLGNIGVYKNEKVILGKSACYFNVIDSVDKDFIRYVLTDSHFQEYLVRDATGTTIKNVSLKQMKNYRFLLPTISKQHAIASTLSCLDDKIELNNRMNRTLEEMAQAIFKSWFVNYEPFLNGEFVDSEMGRIPKGWEVGTFDGIAYSKRQMIKRLAIPDNAVYVGLEHIPRKQLVLDSFGSINQVISDKLLSQKYDVLFGKIRPYFHKVSISPREVYCSSDVIVINAKQSDMYSYALLTAFSEAFVNYAVGTSHGTKMPRAEWNVIKNYKIIIPPLNISLNFNNLIFPIVNYMIENIDQNQRLVKLRESLLPKLMSGEIQVPLEVN
jgi:type I restriction enzyme, S subunit